MNIRNSIRFAIIGPMLLLTVLFGTLVAAAAYYFTSKTAHFTANALSQSRSTIVVSHLNSFISNAVNILNQNAELLATGTLNPDDQAAIQQFFLAETKFALATTSVFFGNVRGGLAVGGHEGNREDFYTIETNGFKAGQFGKWRVNQWGQQEQLLFDLPNFDARKRPWYENAVMSDTVVWSDPYVLFTGEDMSIAPSRAVFNREGHFLGVVGADIFLSTLSDFLRDLNIEGSTAENVGETFLMDTSGTLLATSTDTPVFEPGQHNKPYIRITASESEDPIVSSVSQEIVERYGGYENLPATSSIPININQEDFSVTIHPLSGTSKPDWVVVSLTPTDYFVGPFHFQNRIFLALLVATVLMMAMLSVIITKRIVDPLKDLSEKANLIATGNYNVQFDGSRQDEIGVLNRSFSRMARIIAGTFSEITESESRYRALNQLLPVGVLVFNEDKMVTSANTAAATVLHTKSGKLLGHYVTELGGETYREDSTPFPATERPVAATFRTGISQRNVVMGIVANKTTTWINVNTDPIFAGDRKTLSGVICCITDVTRQREAERERVAAAEDAIKASHIARTALKAAKAGIILFDQQLKVLEWNQQARAIFGVDKIAFEPGYEAWRKLVHPDDLEATSKILEDNARRLTDIDIHYRVICPNGEVRHVWGLAYLLNDQNGKPLYFTSVIFDETERVQQINELIAAKDEAEKGIAAKSEFLATMSHELRTPLNAIVGFAEIMNSPDAQFLSEETRNEYIDIIQTCGKHLAKLINDILDLSRIESDAVELALLVQNPASLIEYVVKMMSSLATKKDITVHTDIQTAANIVCDKLAMQQCITNLLSNAIKFSEPGQDVVISVTETKTDVCISIADNGNGIDQSIREKIGQTFTRSNRAFVASQEGAGLGLAITTRLMKLQNGSLELDSDPERGTTAHLRISRA